MSAAGSNRSLIATLRKISGRPLHRILAGVALCLFAAVLSATAQFPDVLTKPATPSPAPQEEAQDPLGRSTPRGTIIGFVKAADRSDFVTAAKYLQIKKKQAASTETLARELKALMNRYFSEPIALISNSPQGTVTDGLPIDQERVGPLKIDDQKVDVLLTRVPDEKSGQIWLISSETLANVPQLFDAIQENWIDRIMPEPLLTHNLFSIPLAHWLVSIASITVSFFLFWLISHVTVRILKKRAKDGPRRALIESLYKEVNWPAIVILTTLVELPIFFSLGLSLTARTIFGRFALILLIFGVTVMLLRISKLWFKHARRTIQFGGNTGAESGILLANRLLRVLITLVAIFTSLTVLGVDTTTALAGVGIGGVAIAFGAQKTVENILGGIFLVADKALGVGDQCRIGDRLGTVEDITLRSVRLRTPEQTLLSIPAGALAQSNIENFATRGKIQVNTTLEIRYGTNTEQLRSILEGIRHLLANNPRLETDTASIRLASYGPHSIRFELICYVLTRDFVQFVAVREELLLQIGDVIESSGAGFAIPPQLFYMRPDGELERSPVAENQVYGRKGN